MFSILKNIPFHKLQGACCVCECYVHEHTLVSFVRIQPWWALACSLVWSVAVKYQWEKRDILFLFILKVKLFNVNCAIKIKKMLRH